MVTIFEGRHRSEVRPQGLAPMVNSQSFRLFNLEISVRTVFTAATGGSGTHTS